MKRILVLPILLGIVISNIAAQSFDRVQKIVAETRGHEDLFGRAVAVGNGFVIVGAYRNQTNEIGDSTLADAGAAFIYAPNSSGEWIEVQKLVASDRALGDAFGISVDIDGDYAIVGAHHEDHDGWEAVGAAYIFKRMSNGSWQEMQKITHNLGITNDAFGVSVSISGDKAVVGAYRERREVVDAGAAYVFERSGETWTEVRKLVAFDARGYDDRFGISVSISGDYIVVGAHKEDHNEVGSTPFVNPGSAYIYERDGLGVWNDHQKIVAADRWAEDRFGISVDIDGDNLIVGAHNEDEDENSLDLKSNAGSAYIFERSSGGVWSQKQKIAAFDRTAESQFGRSVSIKQDYAIVGSFLDDLNEIGNSGFMNGGSAYIYKQQGTGDWLLEQKVLSPDSESLDQFGFAVATDGVRFVSGAIQESEDENGQNSKQKAGSAYIFESCSGFESSSVIEVSECDSYLSPSGNQLLTSTGIYYDTIPNTWGCDSVVTIDFTFLGYSSSSTIITTACGLYTAPSGATFFNAGIYNDHITNHLGCDSSITIQLSSNNSMSIFTDSICDEFESPSGKFTYTQTGTYYDTIPNNQGCDSLITLNLVIEENVINTAISNMGGTLTVPFSSANTYRWANCIDSSFVVGATQNSFTPTQSGDYAVVIEQNDICLSVAGCENVTLVGWNEFNNQDKAFTVYPNPVSDYVELSLSNTNSSDAVTILDVFGHEVFHENNIEGKLDISSLKSGMYFIIVSSIEGRKGTSTFVKE